MIEYETSMFKDIFSSAKILITKIHYVETEKYLLILLENKTILV